MSDIRRDLRTVEGPEYEPVSLDEAKTWCRVDNALEDALIRALIQAARERAEELTGRSFIPRTLELILDDFPAADAAIVLSGSPVLELLSVDYVDSAGAAQSLDVAEITLVPAGRTPARVAYDTGWPGTNGTAGNVRIQYRAGYAAVGSPDDEAAYQAGVPAAVKVWMQLRVSTQFNNREALAAGSIAEFPRDFVDGLLDGLTLNPGTA